MYLYKNMCYRIALIKAQKLNPTFEHYFLITLSHSQKWDKNVSFCYEKTIKYLIFLLQIKRKAAYYKPYHILYVIT